VDILEIVDKMRKRYRCKDALQASKEKALINISVLGLYLTRRSWESNLRGEREPKHS